MSGPAPGRLIVRLADGHVGRLFRRKADGSGWWLTDGGGLRNDILAKNYVVRSDPPEKPPEFAVRRWSEEGL